MAISDIQRLRQQYIFNPTADITGGEMDLGMSGYSAQPQSMLPPEPPTREPFDALRQIGQPPPTIPTGGTSGTVSPSQGPPTQIDPTRTPAGASPLSERSTLQELIDATNSVYTPETIDRDRLRALMDNVPERNRPSLARAIVAGGLSIKAEDPVKTAEAVMYAPYYRDMAAWKEKAEPFIKTAELEGRGNVNERTLAGNIAGAAVQLDRTASQQRIAEEKNRIAEIRAVAYRKKQEGYTIKVLGDRVKGFKPDGTTIDLGSSGGMNEAEKIDLEGAWRVEAADARGAAAAANTAIRGRILTQDSQNNQYLFDPGTKAIEPIGDAPDQPVGGLTRVSTPSQTTGGRGGTRTNTLEDRRIEQERFKDLFELDAEARRWITKGNNGTFTMKNRPVITPGGFFSSGVTQDDVDAWDRVKKEVDPNYVPPPPAKPVETKGAGPSGTTSAKPTPADTGVGPSKSVLDRLPENLGGFGGGKPKDIDLPAETAPAAPTGRVNVYDKNGKLMGHISDTPAMRAEAAKRGHTPRR